MNFILHPWLHVTNLAGFASGDARIFLAELADFTRMNIIARIVLALLTGSLVLAVAQLSGLLPSNLPREVVWSLPGIVMILFIGILLTDRKIQSTHSQRQTTLGTQVAERTQELQVANQKLEQEIAHRKRVEGALAKQVEEELSVSNARFQAMFNDAAVGMGIMGLDRRIMDANPALCRIYGRPRDELIGMSAADVTDTEDKALAAQLFSELLSGQRDSYEVDRRYIRKNGEVFWAHVTMSAVRGLDGQPLFLIGMVMDIDEQKKMQERIRESQARFQALYDNVAVGIAVMTLERRPISFNSTTERIIGYKRDELQDVDPRLLAVPEDRAMDTELFEELIEGKRNSYVMERRYRHKSGRIFWARVNYSLVRDLEGKPDYLVGIIEDIDDQKRAAERLAAQEVEYRHTLEQSVEERTHKLAEANQRLQKEIEERLIIEEQLAKKAAQEAVTAERTRLARDLHDAVTQTLFSSSLIAEVLPDLWEMDIEEAKNSTEELRQLTRGALAEMRTLLLELRPAALTQTSLSDLIRQLCEAFIGRSRLPISLRIEGDCKVPPDVQVAFYRIAQESLNNVFKYARARQVNVSLILSASGAQFEVCDNGIGFEMSTSKPASLGMRIMRERAEAIGAEFHISSAPGSGTCVEVAWRENPKFKSRGA